MRLKTLIKFKKNSKLIRLTKLYFDLQKTKHLLSFFIGGLKQHQLLNLWKVTLSRQLFLAFLRQLECRLEFILLKSGLVLSGRQARQLILHGHILVNNLPVHAYNFKLKLLDFISINKKFICSYKENLICNLFKTNLFFNFLKKKRLLKKVSISQLFIYFKFPSFLEINYKTFSIFLVKKPSFQEFFFPKIMSLYDCNQLYFIL